MRERRGGTSARIGLHNYDLATKRGVEGALKLAAELQPRFMWISTPCGPFSPIQALFNEKTESQKEKSLQRQERARKVIKSGVQLALQQLAVGEILDGSGPPTIKVGGNLK